MSQRKEAEDRSTAALGRMMRHPVRAFPGREDRMKTPITNYDGGVVTLPQKIVRPESDEELQAIMRDIEFNVWAHSRGGSPCWTGVRLWSENMWWRRMGSGGSN
jgi:hypothetical protein